MSDRVWRVSVPDQKPWAGVPAVDGGTVGHPVRLALIGFYVGMALMIAVPSAFVSVVGQVTSPSSLGSTAPLVLIVFVVPIVLTIVPRTRRFGRYMLLGMVSTALVVGTVGGGVLYVLINRS